MGTLVVGDIHLKQRAILARADAALRETGAGRVVLLGDYCDDWGATDEWALDQLGFLVEWVQERRKQGLIVDVLVGNHDLCYLKGDLGPGTQARIMRPVRLLLERLNMQMAAEVNGFLATHAGVTATWALGEFEELSWWGVRTASQAASRLNAMFADRMRWYDLDSCGCARGGDDAPGPLWADLRELKRDPYPGLPQIVGHTPLHTCLRACGGEPMGIYVGRTAASLGLVPAARKDDPDTLATFGEKPEIWACDTFSLTSGLRAIGDGSMLHVDDDGTVAPVPAATPWATQVL